MRGSPVGAPACLATRTRKASPVNLRTGSCRPRGTASPDDLERKPWRAAAAHQLGDLVPIDVVGGGLGQRPRDPQPRELSPAIHARSGRYGRSPHGVVLPPPVPSSGLLPGGIPCDHARIAKPSPESAKASSPSPQLIVVALRPDSRRIADDGRYRCPDQLAGTGGRLRMAATAFTGAAARPGRRFSSRAKPHRDRVLRRRCNRTLPWARCPRGDRLLGPCPPAGGPGPRSSGLRRVAAPRAAPA
jgi:hypothetical protein